MTDKDSSVRLSFTEMAYGGDAVARDPESGMVVFGWPAIEGETATVSLVEQRRNLSRGRVVSIEEASPLRIEAPCPYFGRCGGCQWQHVSYEGQVRFKHGILAAQLSRAAGVTNLEDV